MLSREPCHTRSFFNRVAIILALSILFSCGCLDIEPEEMPPVETPDFVPVTVSPAVTADAIGNATGTPPPVAITSVKMEKLYRDSGFPSGVVEAVSDFSEGRSTGTINGYLRWESVRAKTSREDKTAIMQQIGRIDYAMFNTTARENITVYIGVSGEQAKKIKNESVFSENGYATASYDPSVIFNKFTHTGRDSEGYLSMCVIDFRKGSHLLFVNATDKEFILPRGSIWDVDRVVTYEKLEYTADSIPRYDDIIQTRIRLIYLKEHP